MQHFATFHFYWPEHRWRLGQSPIRVTTTVCLRSSHFHCESQQTSSQNSQQQSLLFRLFRLPLSTEGGQFLEERDCGMEKIGRSLECQGGIIRGSFLSLWTRHTPNGPQITSICRARHVIRRNQKAKQGTREGCPRHGS